MALDQDALRLAKSIRQVESGGDYNARGGSGEFGAYQFMPETWKSWSKQYLGDSNALPDKINQNKVAYSKIKELKDKGHKASEIASIWNSGKPDYKGKVGTNKFGVAYDVPAYVAKVGGAYKSLKPQTAEASTLEPKQSLFAQQTQAPQESREQRIEQGLPVSTEQRFERTGKATPSFGGNLVRGALEATQLPALGASLQNIAQTVKGEEQTDLQSNFLGTVEPLGKGFDVTSFGPESRKGFMKAVGSGIEASQFIPIVKGASIAKKALTEPVKQTFRQSAIPLAKEGLAQGFLGSTGRSIKEEVPFREAVGAVGLETVLSGVAGPVLGAGASVAGRAISRVSNPAQFFNVKADKTLRNLYQGVTQDAVKAEDAITKAKQGLTMLANDTDINVPDSKSPIGSNSTKKFNFEDASANEFISAVQELGNKVSVVARKAVEDAKGVGRTVDIGTSMKVIEDAIQRGEISRATGNRFARQINGIGNDPVLAHDWVQSVNSKYGRKYEKGTIGDAEISRVADKVAQELRQQLDIIVDRKGYADSFSSVQELKRLIVTIAKKANRSVNFGDIQSDAALDGAIAIITGNPIYMARTFADSAFRNIIRSVRNQSGLKNLRKLGGIMTKSGETPVSIKSKGGRDSLLPLGPRPVSKNLPAKIQGNASKKNNPTIELPQRSQSTIDREEIARIQGRLKPPVDKPAVTLPKPKVASKPVAQTLPKPKTTTPKVITPAQKAVKDGLTVEQFIESQNLTETLRGTKGMTADQIQKQLPNIRLTKDVPAKDIYGNSVVIPEGEKLTPYEMKDGKIVLQDGQAYVVSKNQFQNIKGQSVGGESKPFAPELDGIEETVKGKKEADLEFKKVSNGDFISGNITIRPEKDNFFLFGTGDNIILGRNAKTFEEATIFAQRHVDSKIPPTKYSSYQLPDGKNYKEVLIQVPETLKKGEYGDVLDKSQTFRSSHWDEPNVISHLRLNERTYKGNKVTFMEELQSDWAREARKANEQVTKEIDGYKRDLRLLEESDNVVNKENKITALKEKIADMASDEPQVPNNPLLKNWQEPTIKRALQDAVDNNSAYFAWINGDQTSARYSLATQVKNVEWSSAKNGKYINLEPLNNRDMLDMIISKDGVIQGSSNTDWKGKKLDEVLGKGLADKIMLDESGTLSGEGLKFGGEWANTLYDKQVGNIVKDLTGANIEVLDMGLPIENKGKLWMVKSDKGNFKLTPEGIKVGIEVGDGNSAFIITNILGDGKFKAVPKNIYDNVATKQSNPIEYLNQYDNGRGNANIESFDISTKTTTQQGIRLTPEIKAKIRGEALEIKTSGKQFNDTSSGLRKEFADALKANKSKLPPKKQ